MTNIVEASKRFAAGLRYFLRYTEMPSNNKAYKNEVIIDNSEHKKIMRIIFESKEVSNG